MITRVRLRPLNAALCAILCTAALLWPAGVAWAQAANEPQRAPDRFPIYAIDVAGATELQPSEIEKIVYQFTGPDRSGNDVESARKAIQDAYVAKGFEAVVVEIPPQPSDSFAQGIVLIQVSEAPVGRVRVVDSKYHALTVVREQVPSLVEGKPLNLKTLQTDIAAASRFPDRRVTPSFKPGEVPGTVDVDLQVEDEAPFHASVELNNDNSPSTRSLRFSASLRYTNLWEAGHSASISYIVAPQRREDSEVFAGSYTVPFIGSPWSLSVVGYKSNSNIAALGGTNVLGDGYQLGLRAIYRLPAEDTVQTLSFGPDYKDFKQDIFVGDVRASNSPIRYIPFSADYAISGGDDRVSYSANAGVTVGVRAIKRTVCIELIPGQPCVPVDQFGNRSFGADENFARFNLGFSYAVASKDDFIATFRWQGQLADSPLVSNEQFGIGGLSSVRGYFVSEATGDDGFASTFEIETPSAATLFGNFVDELRAYAFVDSGYARIRRPLPDQQDQFRLIGVGGGARIRLFKLFTGEIVVGVPLRDAANSRKGDPRATFVARGEF